MLDLGCGVGDQTVELVARGARGPDFAQLREEFLGCLTHPGHRSKASVYCCIAKR